MDNNSSNQEKDFLLKAQQIEQRSKARRSAAFIGLILTPLLTVGSYSGWQYMRSLPSYQMSKGNQLNGSGRYGGAITAFDKVIKANPNNHEAFYNKGNALFLLKRYDEAITAYDNALKINPDYDTALYNKACSYSLKGDTLNALDFLKEAIALNPNLQDSAKNDSDFDNIRQDPLFQNLMKTAS